MGQEACFDRSVKGVRLCAMRLAADHRAVAAVRPGKGAGGRTTFAAAIIFEMRDPYPGVPKFAGPAIRRGVVVHPVTGDPDLAAFLIDVITG